MKKKRALFISDLHLSDSDPQITIQFEYFLSNIAKESDQLYILGDLFDYWIGDDQRENEMAWSVARLLNQVSKSGTQIFFLHGNRDFLLGKAFAVKSGFQILKDETVVQIYGKSLLLMHGDTLCTDDIEYLKFRNIVRDESWQRDFLAKELKEREDFALSARQVSNHNKSQKNADIMDVNVKEVEKTLIKYRSCQLIHGHTHKPAHHTHKINGGLFNRYVLPDWDTGGGYLVCDRTGCRLEWLSPYTRFKSN